MVLSHFQGSDEPALLDITIGNALRLAAEKWPRHGALVCPAQTVRLTWAELNRQAASMAIGLLKAGLTPGDRIGIWSLNRAEWTVTQFAAAKAGLILVAINPAYRRTELEFVLNKVGCKALVISPPFKSSNYAGMIASLDGRLPHLEIMIQMGEVTLPDAIGFADVLASGDVEGEAGLDEIEQRLSVTDPINIQFTSGTTGSPKGVTLSHRNILNNGYLVGHQIGLGLFDRICVPVPLYHCFGLVMANLAAVTHGSCLVYPGEGFDPRATLRAVQDERCSALYGVPTMFLAELDQPDFDEFDLSSLRTGIMAGSPCPIEVMRRVIDKMHMRDITICYGMTETSPVSMQTLPGDTLERRVSTVGRTHPHLEVRVVDTQDGVLPVGAPGELHVRGYSTMLGYWDEPEYTSDTLDAEGWLRSGDLATIDAEGYGQIVGRIKDMVIRGGENLYPREIEEFLHRHPSIADVQVFGVPDARFGEELCAWVIRAAGSTIDETSVRAFCDGEIAHHKIPKYIRFVKEFPMTVTGKVRKIEMRERMASELCQMEVEGALSGQRGRC